MATYSGALTSAGLPELADDGEVDFPAMTVRRALHVKIVDPPPPPPGIDEDHPSIVEQEDGDRFHVTVDKGRIRPDLRQFPGGRLPVDTGPVSVSGSVSVTNPTVITPTRIPDSFELRGDALDFLETLTDSVVAKLRAKSRAGWTDLAAEQGGPLWGIGGHPDAESYEWVFAASQTNLAILTGAPGVAWKVTQAIGVLDGDGTTAVQFRVGFSSSGALPAIVSNSAVALRGIVMSHPDCPPGSGLVLGNGTAVIARSQPGDTLYLTCDAATGGSLRVLLTMYPVTS